MTKHTCQLRHVFDYAQVQTILVSISSPVITGVAFVGTRTFHIHYVTLLLVFKHQQCIEKHLNETLFLGFSQDT
jgi:hypothetical protein